MINSGAKTPHTNPFKLPYIHKFNPDTLTPNGEKMMFTLGGQLNVDYPEIFSKPYNHERVNVYASQHLRSQSSARALLMGLYNTSDNVRIHDGGDADRLTQPPFEGFQASEDLKTALPNGYKPFIIDVEDDSEDFMFIQNLNSVCPKAFRIVNLKNRRMIKELDKKASKLGIFLNKKGVSSKDYFKKRKWSSDTLYKFY